MKRNSAKQLVYIAFLTALIAVLAQISFPLPSGVPATMQVFAIAFVGYFIGWKCGVAAVAVYVLLGVFGMPVFASFTGGAYKLVGATGGFIWGFLPFVCLTGLGAGLLKKGTGVRSRFAAYFLGLAGLFVCHTVGVGQFCLVMGTSFSEGLAVASLPVILKDVISLALAEYCAVILAKRLERALSAYNSLKV